MPHSKTWRYKPQRYVHICWYCPAHLCFFFNLNLGANVHDVHFHGSNTCHGLVEYRQQATRLYVLGIRECVCVYRRAFVRSTLRNKQQTHTARRTAPLQTCSGLDQTCAVCSARIEEPETGYIVAQEAR